MSISVSAVNRLVADISPPRFVLTQAVGGFALSVVVAGVSRPKIGEQPIIWLAPDVARVDVGPDQLCLGSATPNHSLHVRTLQTPGHFSYEFRLDLSPAQLAALEDIRGGGDLAFRVILSGVAGNEASFADRESWQQVLTHVVPLSEWIEHLRVAKAMDILLLEIPMPFVDPPAQLAAAMKLLRQAQSLFLQAHYADCVINCRRALEEFEKVLGRDRSGLLKRLATDREGLDKSERQTTIEAAVYHFGNLAVHDGVVAFDRRDAKLMLAVTAALASHGVG